MTDVDKIFLIVGQVNDREEALYLENIVKNAMVGYKFSNLIKR